MKSYLIKNKKYSFMIILFICMFLFIDKVSAYSLKGYDWTSYTTDNASGTINNNSSATINFPLTTPIQLNNGYDFISIIFYKYNFSYDSDIYIDNPLTSYSSNSMTFHCSNGTDYCIDAYINNNYSNIQTTLDGSISSGSITMSARAFDSQNRETLCTYDNNLGMLLCPTVDRNDIAKFQITITQNGYNSVGYHLDLFRQKGWYNNDTTEIQNALSQLGQIQYNTTTSIQNFNNYVSNTSTTQAQSNSTTALGGLSSTFNSHLSQMNDLTQLVFLPINFIITVANNQCQPLVWNIPFVNSQVVVPCMSTIYNGYFSTFIAVFSTIAIGLLTYRCLLKFFNTLKGILDAEDDKIEVIDL